MRKEIGIIGWSTGDLSFGCTKTYLEYFSQFGHVNILTPDENIREDLDLVVLPGGLDTASSNYGEKPGFMNSSTDVYKDYFVENNLRKYIDAGIGVFGICLGFQQLVAYFGSKLTQNLIWHPQSDSRWKEAHEVTSINGGEIGLFPKIQFVKAKYKVNSHHHQGLTLGDESESIIPILKSDDNIVEAFVHNSLAVCGVQYHPEEFYDKYSEHLIKQLLYIGEIRKKGSETRLTKATV